MLEKVGYRGSNVTFFQLIHRSAMAIDPLLAEIDDDYRREKMKNLWRAVGSYIITVTGLILLGTVAIVGWQKYQDNQAQTLTLQLLDARHQLQGGRQKEAITRLQDVAAAEHRTLSPLARLWIAQIQDDEASVEAQKVLKPLLDAEIEQDPYRHFAHLLAGHEADGTGEPHAGPFLLTEREAFALALLKNGKRDEAARQFQLIVQEASAPDTLRARAKLMLATELSGTSTAPADGTAP